VIYIWVRTTMNWEDERAFLAQARPEIRPRVAVWNETFSIPFHLFRHRVWQIARENLSRVEGAVCAGWEEIPDGALVVPVDDDDWFAPNVAEVLEGEYDPGATAYRWVSSFIEVPIHFPHRLGLIRRRIFPGTRPRYVCTTNNYAMVKSPETKDLLRSHPRASRWAEAQEAGVVKRIDQRLSVMNRTLASQTTLGVGRAMIRRSRLIWKFHRYKRLYRRLDLSHLPWSRPYVAMMRDLMDELRIRDR
jgi:hypothetical protein